MLLLRNLHAIGADPKADGFPLSFNSTGTTTESGGEEPTGDGVTASVENNTAGTNDVGDKLLHRFLANKNQETLTLRIAVNNYHPTFQPTTAEAFFMPRKEREGGEAEVKGAEETEGEREAVVRERFVLMNSGMKGLSREEVEGRNKGFGGLVGEGEGKQEGEGEGGEENGEEKDVEMEG